MSPLVHQGKGFRTLLLVLLVFLPAILSQKSEVARLVIDTSITIAETDANYICLTLDWWPEDKCNYNSCPWGSASVLNLNLSHPFLAKAIQAFKTLRVRIGGSLQDQLLYNVGDLTSECKPFEKQWGGLFGYSEGCLQMERWDELNNFFKKTGVRLTFGLNALYGRERFTRRFWVGDWDPSNARDFIRYTLSKGYHIDSWEFGNELCGTGVGASVGAEQYGRDSIHLKAMLDELYKKSQARPSLLAPGGFYSNWWFNKFLQVSGPDAVDIVSHHVYNLGQGNSSHIKSRILNPIFLDKVSSTFQRINSSLQEYGPWTFTWVSESGGVANSGAKRVSDTFLNSFWYLDQLAMAATYNTKVYCRQSLVGGFYELLDKSTFFPNPDYYSALLWHRLMGKGVLSVSSSASKCLRAYAQCTKERVYAFTSCRFPVHFWERGRGSGTMGLVRQVGRCFNIFVRAHSQANPAVPRGTAHYRAGITLLLINLSSQTTYNLEVHSKNYAELLLKLRTDSTKKKSFMDVVKKSVSWLGNRAVDVKLTREEYHLTPENGDLGSKTVLLNGNPVQVTDGGDVPSLGPVHVELESPLSITPHSAKFIVFSTFSSPGCI